MMQVQLYAGIQATMHNAWFRGKNRRAFTAEDFLPSDKPKEPQTWQHKKAILGEFFTAIRDRFREKQHAGN